MNLEELRSVRRTERQKDSLQSLRESFYRDAAAYVEELKAERDRAAEAADDPFSSPEVSRLTDEIESAEEIVESIYERRVGKVVKLATFAAADMSTDDGGLTHEEQDLFDDLVDRIRENRRTVLDTLAGERAVVPEEPSGDTAPASTEEGGDVLSDAMGGEGVPGDATSATDDEPDAVLESESGTESTADAEADPETEPARTAPSDADETAETAETTDRTTVRITRDVGRVLGVDDREYDLTREDVVTLPAANADPLVEREAAERLD